MKRWRIVALLVILAVVTVRLAKDLIRPDSPPSGIPSTEPSDLPEPAVQSARVFQAEQAVPGEESSEEIGEEGEEPRPSESEPSTAEPDSGIDRVAFVSELRSIRRVRDPNSRKRRLALFAEKIAEQDLDTALEWSQNLRDYELKQGLCRGIFAWLARRDLNRALTKVFELKDAPPPGKPYRPNRSPLFESVLQEVFGIWVEDDPRAALSYANELPSGLRSTALTWVFKAWAKKDPGAALNSAQLLPADIRDALAYSVLLAWAESDPVGAAEQLPSASRRLTQKTSEGVVNAIMIQWAETDPVGAMQWAETALSPAMRKRVLDGFYRSWARDNPSEAAYYAAGRVATAPEHRAALDTVLVAWAETDLDGALQWLSSSSMDEATYDEIIVNLAQSFIAARPEQAARIYDAILAAGRLETMQDPLVLQKAIYGLRTLGAAWTAVDYDSAFSWAFGLPEGVPRAYALSNVAYIRALRNIPKATDWIGRLPSGFTHARTAAAYAFGALQAAGEAGPAAQVKRQLDADELDLEAVQNLVMFSSLDPDEKQAIYRMMQ